MNDLLIPAAFALVFSGCLLGGCLILSLLLAVMNRRETFWAEYQARKPPRHYRKTCRHAVVKHTGEPT